MEALALVFNTGSQQIEDRLSRLETCVVYGLKQISLQSFLFQGNMIHV